jgi:hypothetical protein
VKSKKDQTPWVERRGAWAYLTSPDGETAAFQSQWLGFGELLAADPGIYQTMADQYLGRWEPRSPDPVEEEKTDGEEADPD